MSPWHMVGGRSLGDGELIREWDQNFCLNATRMLEIDVAMISRSGHLQDGARLAMVPTWYSPGTSLRGGGDPKVFDVDSTGNKQHIELTQSIPGEKLAGNLRLRSALVLLKPSSSMLRDPLAPKRPGSILWEDSVTLVLEGDASRFPVTVADFVESNLGPAHACWRLEWQPQDFALPAMACLRLYLNSRHEVFHSAVTSQNPDQMQQAVRSSLKFNIGNEMIHIALERAEELLTGEYENQPGTAGKVFMDLISRIFPDQTVNEVKEMRQSDWGQFQATLQARLALFSRLSRNEPSV